MDFLKRTIFEFVVLSYAVSFTVVVTLMIVSSWSSLFKNTFFVFALPICAFGTALYVTNKKFKKRVDTSTLVSFITSIPLT